MQATLPGIIRVAVGRSSLINMALLNNGAVHGEAVRRWCGGGGGGCCRNEGFEDSILSRYRVSYHPLEWVGYIHERQPYNNLRVPVADFGVVVFFYVGESGVAGLFFALALVY